MRGQTPFDLSSKHSSPSKEMPVTPRHQREEELPQETRYRLQRVFQQARIREERYIAIIKEQEIQRKEEANQYLQSLRLIKQQFIQFMELKKPKKDKAWKIPLSNSYQNKKEANRLNSQQFSLKTMLKLQAQSQSSHQKLQPHLQCKITFYYYTPFVKDYIRQVIPQQFQLNLRTIYPNIEHSRSIKIIFQQEESANINCLIERIPFQIATIQNKPITISFDIPCNQTALNYYRQRQFQVQLVTLPSKFVYAYSKLNLYSLLYYEDQQTEWHIKPLTFYSALDGIQCGTMAVKLSNKLIINNQQEHYKIHSNTPMQVGKVGLNYNDEESRVIQRISKFKNAHHSLLLGIGSQRQANAQRFFQRENQKIVLMHRKKKELQSIQQYKNHHKEQLMGKLFDTAINRYYLAECEIGNPKYLIYNYHNTEKQHKKLALSLSLNSLQKDASTSSLNQHISVSIIRPQHFSVLISKSLVQFPSDNHSDYTLDEDETIWAISGMTHPIVVRVLCFPPRQNMITKQTLAEYYQVKLIVKDEYDREVQHFQTKIKLVQPNIEHKLYFHGYCQDQTEFQVPFDEPQSQILPKGVITNNNQIQYAWDERYTSLSLKMTHGAEGQKMFYIIVNDELNLYQIGCYLIVVHNYPRLNREIRLVLGEVQKIKLDFCVGEQLMVEKYQEEDTGKGKGVKDQVRVLFASSKPQHCYVRCQNESQMICKLNKLYEIEARIQTFAAEPSPQRILIHTVDLETNRILKRYLLQIQKEKPKYEKILKLHIDHSRTMRYKFQLHNQDTMQKNYRLYSSNLSILTVPMEMVSLISNQTTSLQLRFEVKMHLTLEELGQPLRVVLTVSDGGEIRNYLFELVVRMK